MTDELRDPLDNWNPLNNTIEISSESDTSQSEHTGEIEQVVSAPFTTEFVSNVMPPTNVPRARVTQRRAVTVSQSSAIRIRSSTPRSASAHQPAAVVQCHSSTCYRYASRVAGCHHATQTTTHHENTRGTHHRAALATGQCQCTQAREHEVSQTTEHPHCSRCHRHHPPALVQASETAVNPATHHLDLFPLLYQQIQGRGHQHQATQGTSHQHQGTSHQHQATSHQHQATQGARHRHQATHGTGHQHQATHGTGHQHQATQATGQQHGSQPTRIYATPIYRQHVTPGNQANYPFFSLHFPHPPVQQRSSSGSLATSHTRNPYAPFTTDYMNMQLDDVPHGLTKETIDRLPQFPITNKKQEFECQICLENAKKTQIVRILPCGHKFHVKCIDQWLKQANTCPTCRKVADE